MDPVTMGLVLGSTGAAAGGAGLTAAAVGGGAAGGAGLFAGLGGFALSNPGLMLGLGSMAVGGKGSGGFAPQFKINLSPEGKRLEKDLFKSIKEDAYPQSLAHRHLGTAKKLAQSRQRQSAGLTKGLGARKRLGALGAEGVMRTREAAGPYAEIAQSKMDWQKDKWQNMMDFMNIQRQAPIMAAQAQMYQEKLKRMSGARKGAGIGSIAQLAAMTAFPIR